MVSGIAPDVWARMLQQEFSGGRMLGLFRGEVEVDDPAYRRAPVSMSEPEQDGDAWRVVNEREVRFPPFSRDGYPVDTAVLFSEDGEELARIALDSFPVLERVEPRFDPGVLLVRGR